MDEDNPAYLKNAGAETTDEAEDASGITPEDTTDEMAEEVSTEMDEFEVLELLEMEGDLDLSSDWTQEIEVEPAPVTQEDTVEVQPEEVDFDTPADTSAEDETSQSTNEPVNADI